MLHVAVRLRPASSAAAAAVTIGRAAVAATHHSCSNTVAPYPSAISACNSLPFPSSHTSPSQHPHPRSASHPRFFSTSAPPARAAPSAAAALVWDREVVSQLRTLYRKGHYSAAAIEGIADLHLRKWSDDSLAAYCRCYNRVDGGADKVWSTFMVAVEEQQLKPSSGTYVWLIRALLRDASCPPEARLQQVRALMQRHSVKLTAANVPTLLFAPNSVGQALSAAHIRAQAVIAAVQELAARGVATESQPSPAPIEPADYSIVRLVREWAQEDAVWDEVPADLRAIVSRALGEPQPVETDAAAAASSTPPPAPSPVDLTAAAAVSSPPPRDYIAEALRNMPRDSKFDSASIERVVSSFSPLVWSDASLLQYFQAYSVVPGAQAAWGAFIHAVTKQNVRVTRGTFVALACALARDWSPELAPLLPQLREWMKPFNAHFTPRDIQLMMWVAPEKGSLPAWALERASAQPTDYLFAHPNDRAQSLALQTGLPTPLASATPVPLLVHIREWAYDDRAWKSTPYELRRLLVLAFAQSKAVPAPPQRQPEDYERRATTAEPQQAQGGEADEAEEADAQSAAASSPSTDGAHAAVVGDETHSVAREDVGAFPDFTSDYDAYGDREMTDEETEDILAEIEHEVEGTPLPPKRRGARAASPTAGRARAIYKRR